MAQAARAGVQYGEISPPLLETNRMRTAAINNGTALGLIAANYSQASQAARALSDRKLFAAQRWDVVLAD